MKIPLANKKKHPVKASVLNNFIEAKRVKTFKRANARLLQKNWFKIRYLLCTEANNSKSVFFILYNICMGV